MASWQSKILKLTYSCIRNYIDPEKLEAKNLRKKLDNIAKRIKPYRTVRVEPFKIQHISAEWLLPKYSSPNAPVIFYLHGGGYFFGSTHTHRFFLSRLADFFNMKILAINYRLAPEQPFPAALEDAIESYLWLQQHSNQNKKIIMMGDSAGGGLVLASLIYLRDKKLTLPNAAVCFSPWLNLLHDPNYEKHDELLTPQLITYAATQYVNNIDAAYPYISPLYGELTNLSPLLIQVGADEMLYKDISIFCERAKESGADVCLQVWEQMPHCWQCFFKLVPEANDAIEKVKDFLFIKALQEKSEY